MEKEKYIADLAEIKKIMNRSSRFLSLSGMSGVIVGLIAIAGAYLAYAFIYTDQDYFSYRQANVSPSNVLKTVLLGGALIISSAIVGLYFTQKKAEALGQQLWGEQAKRFYSSLIIPLVTGGVFCLIMLLKGFVCFIAPACLIFYGLALVNASKYSLDTLKGLGLCEITLGLLSLYYIGYGLAFWVLGFGVLHIAYGLYMHIKYD